MRYNRFFKLNSRFWSAEIHSTQQQIFQVKFKILICRNTQYIFTSILFLSGSLYVCFFVSSKRLNRWGPNFLWDLTWLQGRFMDYRIFKNVPLTKFDFWKSTIFYLIPRNFLLFLYYVFKEKMFTIEIKDGYESPYKPSFLHYNLQLFQMIRSL